MWVSNSSPRRDWELDEAPAVRDPAHMAEIGNGDRASIGERQWRMTFQGRMAARRVGGGRELGQLPFQVTGIPERDLVWCENSAPRRVSENSVTTVIRKNSIRAKVQGDSASPSSAETVQRLAVE